MAHIAASVMMQGAGGGVSQWGSLPMSIYAKIDDATVRQGKFLCPLSRPGGCQALFPDKASLSKHVHECYLQSQGRLRSRSTSSLASSLGSAPRKSASFGKGTSPELPGLVDPLTDLAVQQEFERLREERRERARKAAASGGGLGAATNTSSRSLFGPERALRRQESGESVSPNPDSPIPDPMGLLEQEIERMREDRRQRAREGALVAGANSPSSRSLFGARRGSWNGRSPSASPAHLTSGSSPLVRTVSLATPKEGGAGGARRPRKSNSFNGFSFSAEDNPSSLQPRAGSSADPRWDRSGGAASTSPASPEADARSPPLGRAAIERLPAATLTEVGARALDDDSTCGVCDKVLEVGERIVGLVPCGHMHHKGCTEGWLGMDGSCPTCQTDVEV